MVMAPGFVRADINSRRSPVVIAVEKVSPAVVNISSEYEVYNRSNPFFSSGLNNGLNDFFNDFLEPRYRNKSKRYNLGSGVIIDGKRGYILTNAHVIEKTSHITVSLNDNREFDAQVVGADPESDLAVLQIKTDEDLPAVEMGNSHDLMIGETVIAIGNPFGFSNTVSTGVISATDRNVKSNNTVYKNFIQIDAPINPGNSGGPLLNILGELIGINTAIYANAQGIGFAIPIDKAKSIISNLIKYGEVIQAWTGLVVQDIDKDIADYLNIQVIKGVLVKDVAEKSPAAKAGFKKWDVIQAINAKPIENEAHFQSVINDHSAGDVLNVSVIRSGKSQTVSLKTTAFPLEQALDLGFDLIGIRVVSKDSIKGVMISEISRMSQLYGIGVRPGDQIRQINDMQINSESDYQKAIIKYRNHNSLVVLVVRNGTGYYITLQL
jgi:serine protease Do